MTEDSRSKILRIAPVLRGIMATPSGKVDTPYQRVILETVKDAIVDSDCLSVKLPAIPPNAESERLKCDIASIIETFTEEHGSRPSVIEIEGAKALRCVEPRASTSEPLSGEIALVTGAAGAIGSGICRELLEKGCRVAAADLAGERLDTLVKELQSQGSGNSHILGVAMDVTNPQSVKNAFETVVLEWGGIDVVIANAGIAHVAAITEMTLEDFRRLESVNVEGTLLTLAEAGRCMRAQGTGGDIVLVSTKNVFSPGARFGAYSATKASAHQLARIASLEMAEFDVRVNMVAPDAVFGDPDRRSGLWEAVGPDRMRDRGLDPKGLREHYRNRNLLKATVTAHHVANAVMFFVTRQTPTTGATIPIDGGLPDATPR